MAKIKIVCPGCGRFFKGDQSFPGKEASCPHCNHRLLIPESPGWAPTQSRLGSRLQRLLLAGLIVAVIAVLSIALPTKLHWPDRRPIGVLFLASNYHSSATNPRGWFNEPSLNVTGQDGLQQFKKALSDYTDRSIAILKRINAQGVIVWDLEGEQFPHKITYIGDPRLVGRLAPEMAPVVDEFFARLRNAGLRVGLTIRPQQLVFDSSGHPKQQAVANLKRVLQEKIDHACNHWGATIFYVDSNAGIRRPDEAWQLRRLADQRPDILLIAEHHNPLYRAFSAPYISLRHNDPGASAGLWQKLFPDSFQAIDISDATNKLDTIVAAKARGDILLFRAWVWTPECQLLDDFAHQQKNR